nr:SJCHGC04845 protein [Schistosoma japonicum]
MSLVLFGSIGALSDLQYVAVYLMGPPFLWNPEAVGLYSGITDVTAALISVTCTIVIIKFHAKKRSKVQNNVKNQKNEKHYTRQMNLLVTVFAVAMVMLIINCSMVGMAHQFSLPTANILIYIAAVPRLMKSFCVPLIRTMFSICTHPSKQGFMQSVAAFVSRIGLLISFTALPAIYAATVLTFPGTVFIVVVIILMITLIIDLFVPLVVKKGNVDVKADEFNGIYSVQEEEKLDNILNFCGDTF